MKKHVYIIRHAQAEDLGYSSMLKDFNRELTSRGIMQSARMGKFLFDLKGDIDRFVSSPANRAADTARVMLEQFKRDKDELVLAEELYGGGPKGYLKTLNEMDEAVGSFAIFGHNPDISFFAEYLTRDDIGGSMNKASVILMEFEDLNWAEISGNTGKLIFRKNVSDLINN